METLLDILEKESQTAIKSFKQNQMIVNPDKFQAMVLGRHKHKHIWIIICQIFAKALEINKCYFYNSEFSTSKKKGSFSKYICLLKF